MRYQIRHVTQYVYTRPVFLEPHLIRLRPRSDASQHLFDYRWRIDPLPFTASEHLDVFGNGIIQATFEDLTESLRIETEFEIETRRQNPFDYFPDPSAESLRFTYADELKGHLAPYCARPIPSRRVDELAEKIADSAENRTLPFLSRLTQCVQETHRQIIRETGDPLAPEVTLDAAEGSCRDLTVLFMDACRSVGLAARFVSGYQEGAQDQGERDLHAWAEVYLPGGGWRGYDPTLGLAVADRHIPLAASSVPGGAAPVTGTFRGNHASSTMEPQIEMQFLEETHPHAGVGI
jgi:transglutaminase-like putative cysteine protease